VQQNPHTPRSHTVDVFGSAVNFFPTSPQVSAKAFTVFAFLLVVTSFQNARLTRYVSDFLGSFSFISEQDSAGPAIVQIRHIPEDTDTANDECFSPFAFEHDINPVIHRPYIKVSQHVEVTNTHHVESESFSPPVIAVQSEDPVSSAPSTPLESPDFIPVDGLDTPVTSISTNTSPYSSILGSITRSEGQDFVCCLCQEEFLRRCDLK
jgi:hypothetical protein